jgi:hypothetical protein
VFIPFKSHYKTYPGKSLVKDLNQFFDLFQSSLFFENWNENTKQKQSFKSTERWRLMDNLSRGTALRAENSLHVFFLSLMLLKMVPCELP